MRKLTTVHPRRIEFFSATKDIHHMRKHSTFVAVGFSLLMTLSMVVSVVLASLPASADQVIVDRDPESSVTLADDVECSACDQALSPSAIEVLTSGAGGEVTAGQLWSFFNAQGVDSMDELTLHLDIDPEKVATSAGGSSIDISSLQLQIENPDGIQGFATDVQIGDKQVLLPTASRNADSADMQLAVKLHYDFMKRFSADSTEKIKLNVSSSGLMPSISIAKKTEALRALNWPLLIGFTIFWLGVFALVNWLTKPKANETSLSRDSGVEPSKNHAISV